MRYGTCTVCTPPVNSQKRDGTCAQGKYGDPKRALTRACDLDPIPGALTKGVLHVCSVLQWARLRIMGISTRQLGIPYTHLGWGWIGHLIMHPAVCTHLLDHMMLQSCVCTCTPLLQGHPRSHSGVPKGPHTCHHQVARSHAPSHVPLHFTLARVSLHACMHACCTRQGCAEWEALAPKGLVKRRRAWLSYSRQQVKKLSIPCGSLDL